MTTRLSLLQIQDSNFTCDVFDVKYIPGTFQYTFFVIFSTVKRLVSVVYLEYIVVLSKPLTPERSTAKKFEKS